MASAELGGDSPGEGEPAGPSAAATTNRTCPVQKAAHGGKPPPSAVQPGRGDRIAHSHFNSLGEADAPRSRSISPALGLKAFAVTGSKQC